ncbi:MAG: 16S rRNA (cytidine(1402)-2'-O)-methyltransferase [Gammaproteobacteria bacterium]|nr:16S rRNA (cytidine(1402)-2'-O)-methyltransferase [Gammaproteobacteria bacterium]
MSDQGTLFIVATPIGNVGDITDRARAVLNKTDFIACEDTRRASKLLRLLSIDPKTKSLRSFNVLNENDLTAKIIASLTRGQDVALISDAGTPLLSDPGLPLLKEAIDRGVAVVPVPGPSALTACLSVCPLPMHDFRFVGFIERKRSQKKALLSELLQQSIPVVCFESPKRLLDTLRVMSELGAGGRMMFVARELTKLHEEQCFDSVNNLIENFEARERILGEFVLVIAPLEEPRQLDVDRLVEILSKEPIPASSSARLLAKLSGISRQEAYRRLTSSTLQDD